MGSRANIELRQRGGSVHIYVHWLGDSVPGLLVRALNKGRTDDPSYFARTIATELFVGAGVDDAAGAGLAPVYQDGTPWVVDLEARTIAAPLEREAGTYRFGLGAYPIKHFTYAEFLAACQGERAPEFAGGE